MDFFSECPNSGHRATFWTYRNIYYCNNCGLKYCDKCSNNDYSCPDCGSDDFDKIGEVQLTEND